MTVRLVILAAMLYSLTGCYTDPPVESPPLAEGRIAAESPTPAEEPAAPVTGGLLSGRWMESGGIQHCDGYLTRNESEEYCADSAPADWSAFRFNGDTYFRQPLAVESDIGFAHPGRASRD